VLRVQGLASSQPFDEKDPAAPANRRISIIVMNRDAEDRMFRPLDPAAAEAGDSSASGATNSTVSPPADASSAAAH
jgi:chemotaxis protein MotB